MKTTLHNIALTLMALVAATSCGDDANISDLNLSGDCAIQALAVDGYDGTVDASARTVTVRVPESYDLSEVTVSTLALSPGASSDVVAGDKLNLTVAKLIHVANGDVFLNWTVTARRDQAKVLSFKINGTYTGIIDEASRTISVYVPNTLDLSALVPTFTLSADATASLASGVPADFSSPVSMEVVNNTARAVYTITVTAIGKPQAVYMGLAASMDALNAEEQAACQWMLAAVPNSLYASMADIKAGSVDLSECKVIWWHYHKDGGVDGKNAFEAAAPEALDAAVKLKDYYNAGGSFLFTRYATNMPYLLGAVANDGCPNNCWGQNEAEAETVGGPWSFFITGHTDHPMFQNLVMKSGEPTAVYTCDAGYRITNSTAQWHIGSDWGGYADYDAWRAATGGVDLAYGGDGAIVAWEFPANGSRGGILCIGSGCYDWYSIDVVPEELYHPNVASMTKNAFDYLMNN